MRELPTSLHERPNPNVQIRDKNPMEKQHMSPAIIDDGDLQVPGVLLRGQENMNAHLLAYPLVRCYDDDASFTYLDVD